MKDMNGFNVEVGDLIAFAKGGQQDTNIYTGVVKSIVNKRGREGAMVGANQLPRHSDEIILLKNYKELMKENYPELMI